MNKKGRVNDISLICGIICASAFFTVMNVFGNPYDMIHKVDSHNLIPPIWLWKTTMTVWGFLIGYAAGRVMTKVSRGISVDEKIIAYRGGLFFISAFFLSLSHYPIFFCAEKLFIALISVIPAAALALLCAFSWSKAYKSSALIILGFAFWLFYVIFVNAGVLLRV